jgi:uncharacterized protein YcnI
MFKKIFVVVAMLGVLLMPAIASAHVVVTPDEVETAQYQIFDVSVPNEKQVDVTEVKLLVPTRLKNVTPTTKTGWTIQTDKSSEDAAVKSITWSGGSISSGQRDDFTFQAQAPGQTGDLTWKAYQTYADGTVVSWDQKPSGSDEEGKNSGPYSVTKVVSGTANNDSSSNNNQSRDINIALLISIAALALSVTSLLSNRVRNKK